MQKIKPSTAEQEIICAEIQAPPAALVVFGASGDLVRRKLIPSIFELAARGLVNERFYILGCSRKKFSDKDFRHIVQDSVKANSAGTPADVPESFLKSFYYISGDYDDEQFYRCIKKRLTELDSVHNVRGNHIFYLAVPPLLYTTIIDRLGRVKLSCGSGINFENRPKLVVEKPFGSSLETAVELNRKIHECFDESQIYRIDHYLGKETVQNILMFRFANAIFEPIWNRNYIDHIQITIAESIGVEHRASYYDKAGALRDMFQNHVLGMLSLVAMEPPASFDADHIRNEKVKLLQSIRPLEISPSKSDIIPGQYTQGKINGASICGYRAEPGIPKDSKTETFIATRMFIDNWRWKGVSFYLRTGKRLATKLTEIAITFKKVPHSMFASVGLDDMPANVLVLKIQPDEGISLSFQAKRPGSKACIDTLNMDFNYADVFGTELPEAYQRLLLDCMAGDQTLFTRQDDVQLSWALLNPVLEAWQSTDSAPYEYPAGSESFGHADSLIESDGRYWRKLL
jgi:glucose-6-phosphate 1-dehydrogenase